MFEEQPLIELSERSIAVTLFDKLCDQRGELIDEGDDLALHR